MGEALVVMFLFVFIVDYGIPFLVHGVVLSTIVTRAGVHPMAAWIAALWLGANRWLMPQYYAYFLTSKNRGVFPYEYYIKLLGFFISYLPMIVLAFVCWYAVRLKPR